MAKDTTDEFIGQVINNFEIQDLIGKGGMGIVYRAYHPDLELYAAVKIMRPKLAKQPGFYERFLQEARTAARLGHPNIVDVINFGTFHDSYYLMMDYIEGPSLRQLVKENKQGIPLWDAVQISWQIADVLVYAHAADVLHRDLKPDNILLTHSVRPNRPYRVIVTDFGLVKLGQGSILETQKGISVGTPAYMSPEQCAGEEVDGRTDIYALGVLLYETVTGRRPYPIRNLFDAAKYHGLGETPTPTAHKSDTPRELDELIQSMLVPQISQRMASAAEAIDALQELLVLLGQDGEEPNRELQRRIVGTVPKEEVKTGTKDAITTPPLRTKEESDERYFLQVAFMDSWEETVYPISNKPIIVGRLPDSSIVLDRPGQRFVSRRHCEIIFKDGRVLVRDLGSANGTFLDGRQLDANAFYEWLVGTEVQLGPFTLALRSDRELLDVPSPTEEPAIGVTITKIQGGLKLSCPNGVPSRLPLEVNNPMTIGRALDCDMVLEHPHVSNHHCRIRLTSSGPEVVDLRSTNGTFMHEQVLPPHAPVPWRDFSEIRVGPFKIGLEDTAVRSDSSAG
ncbi:MAG: FHA domain-containing serine/threonine-protein kinase [Candidatus Promineifilaceae bacterium]